MVPYDHKYFIQAIRSGRADRAADYAYPYAEANEPAAMVDLAQALRALEREQESAKWISRAEKLARLDDPEYLLAMWHAFSLARLGGDADGVRTSKGFHYLKRLAENGNVAAQEQLMIAYLEGSSGAPQSNEQFRYWAEVAKSAGSQLALDALKSLR